MVDAILSGGGSDIFGVFFITVLSYRFCRVSLLMKIGTQSLRALMRLRSALTEGILSGGQIEKMYT